MPEIAQATTELPPHSHGVDTTAASFDTSNSSMSSCMKQARSLLNAVSSCSQSSTPTSSKKGEDQNTQPWEMDGTGDQPMEKYTTPHRNDRKRSRPLRRSDPSTWPNAPLVSSPLGEGSRKRRRTESAFTASSESLDVEEELEPSVALQGLDDSGTLRAGVLVACTQRAHEDSILQQIEEALASEDEPAETDDDSEGAEGVSQASPNSYDSDSDSSVSDQEEYNSPYW